MNVLLTGASGMLGSHIYNELRPRHRVVTLGRQAVGRSHVFCDLASQTPDLNSYSFDYVVHAAGKAHSMPKSRREKESYSRVNVEGTLRLLTALEQSPRLPNSIVYISTVLVYGRSEGLLMDEQTPAAAEDVYGRSKIEAENIVRNWGQRLNVRTTILRLPLVVALRPNGNLAALIKAIRHGYYVRMSDGAARRSMVRADDVAALIPRAARASGTFNLTDGHHFRIRDIENAILWQTGRNRLPAVPIAFAEALAAIGDGINALIGRKFPFDSNALCKLTRSLTFSDQAARRELNWTPRPVLDLLL